MKWPIRSKEEFEALMDDVDSTLQSRDVPIPARQFAALGEVTKKFHITLPGGPLWTGPIPNVYEGESLSAHIFQWFDQRYGDRLKKDWSVGYSVVMLRGDAWLLKFPLIYGIVTIVCDRDLQKKYRNFAVNRAGQPQQKAMMNLLSLIEKLPQGLASRLTDDELQELLSYFSAASEFFMTISDLNGGNELASGAVMDLEISARFATSEPQCYGQSLWASLQAAEKMLKCFIASKDEKFPPIHELSKLAKQAYALGLPQIDADLLKRVQCKADVRYGQQKYALEKVVGAHQGALQIASLVAEIVFPHRKKDTASMPQQIEVKEKSTPSETIFRPGHFYHSPTLGFSYFCKEIIDGVATIILVESYQHGKLFQAVFKQKVEHQSFYEDINDEAEINRLKQVGEKIFRAQGISKRI